MQGHIFDYFDDVVGMTDKYANGKVELACNWLENSGLNKDEIMVNSRHKKTIETHPNLIVNCICEDGYADGVEAQNKKFYMALRFHSESLYKIDENHKKIIQAFINACKNN